jgi:two-component system sensor histidine kinase KdpD
MKRLLGKKSVVERLIENPRGMTIVVLDTRKHEARGRKFPVEMPEEDRVAAGIATAPATPLNLTRFLRAQRILVWNEPVGKEEILRRLVEATATDGGIEDVSSVVDEVIESDRKRSTFFNEGAAFPHVRVKGLSSPLISLGLTRKGVTDVSTDHPIESVFLILSPAESPQVQLQILALVSRAAQSPYLNWNLRSARTAEEAMQDIRDWETLQVPGGPSRQR